MIESENTCKPYLDILKKSVPVSLYPGRRLGGRRPDEGRGNDSLDWFSSLSSENIQLTKGKIRNYYYEFSLYTKSIVTLAV